MPPLRLDAEPEGPGPIPGTSLQGLRLHLRRIDRPTRAGGENIAKKKEKTTMRIDGGPAVPFPSKAADKEIEKALTYGLAEPVAAEVRKRMRQQDLEGGILPDVTRETEEQPPLNVFRAGRFVIKLTDDALERVLTKKKDQTNATKEIELKRWTQGRAKITGADPIGIGEYDYAVEALWEDFKEML